MGSAEFDADWAMALAAVDCLALACAAPNAKDKPIVHAMTLVESNWLGPPLQRL